MASPYSRSSSTAVKLVASLNAAPILTKSASCMDPPVKASKVCSEHSSTAGSAAAEKAERRLAQEITAPLHRRHMSGGDLAAKAKEEPERRAKKSDAIENGNNASNSNVLVPGVQALPDVVNAKANGPIKLLKSPYGATGPTIVGERR